MNIIYHHMTNNRLMWLINRFFCIINDIIEGQYDMFESSITKEKRNQIHIYV